MAFGDDSFIREVNEDIRQERLGRLWYLLKPFIIGGAAAIILAVIGAEFYSSYKQRQAQNLGDAYIEALKLADAGPDMAAFAKLTDVQKSGFGGYPLLAEFRAASALAQKGDRQGAVKAFDALAANAALPLPWREAASVRAAYLLVDSGSFADVEQRVKKLATDVNPMRLAAREALGLAAWKAGRLQEAAYYFNRNYSDKDSAAFSFSERAAMMIGLISSESENGAPAGSKGGAAAALPAPGVPAQGAAPAPLLSAPAAEKAGK